jgi:hypothetical protein
MLTRTQERKMIEALAACETVEAATLKIRNEYELHFKNMVLDYLGKAGFEIDAKFVVAYAIANNRRLPGATFAW